MLLNVDDQLHRATMAINRAIHETKIELDQQQAIVGEYRKFVESFDPKWAESPPDRSWVEFENPHGWSARYERPILYALALTFLALVGIANWPQGTLLIAIFLCVALYVIFSSARHDRPKPAEIDAQRLAEQAAIIERCDSQDAAWLKGDVEWGMYGRGTAPTPLTICFTPVDYEAIRLRPAVQVLDSMTSIFTGAAVTPGPMIGVECWGN
jgi:hypothetical protein